MQEVVRRIAAELNEEFLERDDAVRALVLALLASEHVMLLGPRGTAKSQLAQALADRITGTVFFRVSHDPDMSKDDTFGGIDMRHYEEEGEWLRSISGMLPQAHLAMLDEIDKVPHTSLASYLSILNERQFRNGSWWLTSPLITAVAAANDALPAGAPLWDRFLVRLYVDYLADPGNFVSMLAGTAQRPEPTTITLQELQAIHAEVAAVHLMPGTLEALVDLRAALAEEGVVASDRRWKQATGLLRASAWLDGRDAALADDLDVLRHVLWESASQIDVVATLVRQHVSMALQWASTIADMLTDIEAEVLTRQSMSATARGAYGGEALFKLGELEKDVLRINREANTALVRERLEQLDARLARVREQVGELCTP